MKFMWENMTKSQLMSSARRIIGLFFIFVFVQMASGQGVTIRTDCVANPMERQEGSRICIPFIMTNDPIIEAFQLQLNYDKRIFIPDTIISGSFSLFNSSFSAYNIDQSVGEIRISSVLSREANYQIGDTFFIICGVLQENVVGESLTFLIDKNFTDVISPTLSNCAIEVAPKNNVLSLLFKSCGISSASANDGSFGVRALGGVAPYTYSLSLNGNFLFSGIMNSDTTFNNLGTGNYSINITDSNGTQISGSRNVSQEKLRFRDFNIIKTNPTCPNTGIGTNHLNGSIIVTPKNPIQYGFKWSDNVFDLDSTKNIKLEAGVYGLTITDFNTNCSIDTTLELISPSYSVGQIEVLERFTCFEPGVQPIIKLSVSGGTPRINPTPYRFAVLNRGNPVLTYRDLQSDGIINSTTLTSQSTFISIMDANRCDLRIPLINPDGSSIIGRDTFELNQDTLLLKCFESLDSTFSIRMVNTTGNRPDVIRINSYINTITNQIFQLPEPYKPTTDFRRFEVGKYKIATATFDQKCRDTFDFEVIRPAKIIHSVAVNQPTCSDTIGSINITSSGGTPPFTYTWAHNRNLRASRLDSVSRGPYRVSVVDANNCAAFDTTITITPSTIVKLDSVRVRKDILCGQPGTIGAFSSIPGTTFRWSSGETTQFINPSTPGMYIVTAKVGACEIKDSVQIRDLSNIRIELGIKIDAQCSTGPNSRTGSIQIGRVTGAQGAFTRSWFKEGQQAEVALNVNSVSNLAVGNYRLKITDSTGCVKEELFSIGATIDTVFVALDRTSITTIQCKGKSNGEAAASASGGNDNNYAIRWSTGQISQRVTNLAVGRNWVVASNQGCFSDTTFFNVVEADTVEVLKSIINPSCREAPDGKGTVEIVGKQASYEIIWTSINKRGPSFDSLRLGSYPVAIRNIADPTCVIFDTVHVVQSGIFRIAIDSALTSLSGCNSGIPSGQVTLKLDRGTGPVNYTLNGNNLLGGVARGLAGGTYNFIGINAKGCIDTVKSFTLVQSEPVSAQFAKIDSILCNGGKTCIRLTNARGGSGRGYTYAVNFSRNIPIDSCFEVFSGRYKINVFDSDGCGRELELTIGQPEKFEIDLDDEIVYQLGGEKPTIDIKPSIGSNIVNVNWSIPDLIECKSDNCQQVQVKEYTTVELLADAVNQNGCIARGRIKLLLNEKENVFVPSVLKPDNQVVDFENARWKITIGEGIEAIKTLKILDRWGNIVHMAENINNDYEGWDGRWNGQELPPGVYAYVAEIQFVPVNAVTKSKVYSGSITLLK